VHGGVFNDNNIANIERVYTSEKNALVFGTVMTFDKNSWSMDSLTAAPPSQQSVVGDESYQYM